jgi:hypothetical protein
MTLANFVIALLGYGFAFIFLAGGVAFLFDKNESPKDRSFYFFCGGAFAIGMLVITWLLVVYLP